MNAVKGWGLKSAALAESPVASGPFLLNDPRKKSWIPPEGNRRSGGHGWRFRRSDKLHLEVTFRFVYLS